MKISITIFIFLSFISYVINDPFGSCGTNPTSAADCKDENIRSNDKKAGYVKCCLLELKKNEDTSGKSCIPITEKQGKKLGTIIKDLEKDYFYYAYDLSIDCKSSYLKAGLVLLISFIIF